MGCSHYDNMILVKWSFCAASDSSFYSDEVKVVLWANIISLELGINILVLITIVAEIL